MNAQIPNMTFSLASPDQEVLGLADGPSIKSLIEQQELHKPKENGKDGFF